MSKIRRQSDRFCDFGRVESSSLSQLPGVLEDISLNGCKVRFPISLTVDMDADYTLKIHPSLKTESTPLVLVCHPQWVKELDCSTTIGFNFLRSPDTARLQMYIQQLATDNADSEQVQFTENENICRFV